MKKAARVPDGFGRSVPPTLVQVNIYFLQKGFTATDAETFYKDQHSRKWKTVTGRPVGNWKTVANDWMFVIFQQERRHRNTSIHSPILKQSKNGCN